MKKIKFIFLMVAGLLLFAGGQALAEEQGSGEKFTVTVLENAKGSVSVSPTQDGAYTNPCTLEVIQEGVDKGKGIGYFKVTPEDGWKLNGFYEKNGEAYDSACGYYEVAKDENSVIYSASFYSPKDVTIYPVFQNIKTGDFSYIEGTEPVVPMDIRIQTAENKAGSALVAYNDYTVDLNDQVFYQEIFFKNTQGYSNTCNFAVKVKALDGYRFYDAVMDQTKEYGVSVISSMGRPEELEDGSIVYDAFIDAEEVRTYSTDGVLKIYPIFRNIETGELVYSDETPVTPPDPDNPDPEKPENPPVEPVNPAPSTSETPQEPEKIDAEVAESKTSNPKTGIQEEIMWGAAAVIMVAALAVVAGKRLINKK